jgi:hypothetical protein
MRSRLAVEIAMRLVVVPAPQQSYTEVLIRVSTEVTF